MKGCPMAIALWVLMLALIGCGLFLRSVARRFSNLGRRRKVLLVGIYVAWAVLVMVIMLWIGAAATNVVGPWFVPVMLVLAALAAFSDDIRRLARRVSAPRRNG